MSEWGHDWTAITGLGKARPVYVRVFDYPNGYYGNFHRHQSAQLVYSLRGVASVYSNSGRWMVSPLRAVTIPPWENPRVGAEGNTLLHSLFIDPKIHPDVITHFGVVSISSVLHALIKEAGTYYADYELGSTEERLLELVVEFVKRSQVDSSIKQLPTIKHPRIAKALAEFNDEQLRSAEVANKAALSPRQFARVFKADTGMAFKDWRALYQVQRSIILLQQGKSVSEVASYLGFSSASAFIALFKKHTGTTPALIKSH